MVEILFEWFDYEFDGWVWYKIFCGLLFLCEKFFSLRFDEGWLEVSVCKNLECVVEMFVWCVMVVRVYVEDELFRICGGELFVLVLCEKEE